MEEASYGGREGVAAAAAYVRETWDAASLAGSANPRARESRCDPAASSSCTRFAAWPSSSTLWRARLLPHTQTWHIIDEMLAKITLAEGEVTPFVRRRMVEHAAAAEDAGAAALQVTCSSISPAVPAVQPLVAIPVLAIDDAMIERALGLGRSIGIAATTATALESLSKLTGERAAAQGRPVEIERLFCEGAYERLLSGDLAEHDRIAQGYLAELASRCDVVMVAQASMARPRRTPWPPLPGPRFSAARGLLSSGCESMCPTAELAPPPRTCLTASTPTACDPSWLPGPSLTFGRTPPL